MTGAPLHDWTLEEVLRAADVGALGGPYEFLDGRLWSIPVGGWQAAAAARMIRALPAVGTVTSTGQLFAGGALLLPDLWVRRADAEPTEQLSRTVPRWASQDVLLVVEVCEETVDLDLVRKARLYAAAGYAEYWVVTRRGIFVHTDPVGVDYALRVLRSGADRLVVPYPDGGSLDVAELVGSPA
jgi:hypothetical protein